MNPFLDIDFASQSESERAHKVNNEVKTKLRNRLEAGTTDKLVYVHCNSRVNQDMCKPLYSERFLQWGTVTPGVGGVSGDVISEAEGSSTPSTTAPIGVFASLFKPIGRAWMAPLSIANKKLKGASGTSIHVDSGAGVDDGDIEKMDTILIPISQFNFTAEDIESRFDGDIDVKLRGVVTRVTTNSINIKFDGDMTVSPYPKQGYGEYVVKRKFRCDNVAFFTESSFTITEFHINEVLFGDWLEGDLLNFAIADHFPTADAPTTVLSSYFAACSGNTTLSERYSAHVDFKQHKVLFVPVEAGKHWSLLAWDTVTAKLYSMDSGRSLLFAHSNTSYATAIDLIQTLVNRSPLFTDVALTHSPICLETAVQPNSVDCGFHVVLNAKSLAAHVNGGGTIDTWVPPASGVREINAFRKSFGRRCLQQPLA
jgi:hypothetical protein